MNPEAPRPSWWGKPVAGMSEAELIAACADPQWRIRNLYWIMDKDGRPALFEPWEEQQKLYDNLWYRNVVPKARQRGFSTAVQIMMFDAALFVPNTATAVIAQDEGTALQIFQKKIRYAWDRLPGIVREMAPLRYLTKHEMVWDHDSSILVATSTRGTTLQYLHISEYGQICAHDPARADEIQEGSLPSVDAHGVIVVESTVETPYGHFSEMVRQAQRIAESGRPLQPMEYRLHFASWWDAPEYEADPEHVAISPKDNAYFFRTEAAIKRPIPPRKRAWYVLKRDNDFGGSNEKMWRQYPSTLEEAFTVSSAGLWLADQMAAVRVSGRIVKGLPLRAGVPVNTWWDLGVTTDSNCCWLHQDNDPWDDFIGFIETWGEPYSAIVRMMQEEQQARGFVWGKHFLPHDGDQTRPGAETLKTPRDMLEDLGLKNIEIVPRIADVGVGIEQLREDFPSYRFDEERCAEGIKHLDNFSKVRNQTMAIWTPQIQKNGHQHGADALRQKAQWAHRLRGARKRASTGRRGSAMTR